MDRDGMSNLYRGPSIDASYQVSVHLAKWLQKRRIFKISQSEIRVAYGDASMEVLYKDCSFRPYQLTNMAATGKSCFLLVNF
jgi:indole-3-glycerol phosphate synthase